MVDNIFTMSNSRFEIHRKQKVVITSTEDALRITQSTKQRNIHFSVFIILSKLGRNTRSVSRSVDEVLTKRISELRKYNSEYSFF